MKYAVGSPIVSIGCSHHDVPRCRIVGVRCDGWVECDPDNDSNDRCVGAVDVRVIAGEAKGRRLRATRSEAMRPTTDLMRRVIFDILGDVVRDAQILDLFAGAGTLGIEALSRGAKFATFVERDAAACRVIQENLAATAMAERATVVRAEVARYLRREAPGPADLVFLDPPYDAGLAFLARTLEAVAAGGWVRAGGTVVLEAEVGRVEWPRGFREIRIRRSGRTQVSMAVRDGERTDSDLPGHV